MPNVKLIRIAHRGEDKEVSDCAYFSRNIATGQVKISLSGGEHRYQLVLDKEQAEELARFILNMEGHTNG